MRHTSSVLLLVALFVVCPTHASALDLSLLASLGTGKSAGPDGENLYAGNVGGAVEFMHEGFVVSFRGIRSFASGGVPGGANLVSLGGDAGYEWTFLSLLHLSPRVGLGQLRTRDADVKQLYVEPTVVLDVQVGWFVVGADVRYRVGTRYSDASGLLANARIGWRF